MRSASTFLWPPGGKASLAGIGHLPWCCLPQQTWCNSPGNISGDHKVPKSPGVSLRCHLPCAPSSWVPMRQWILRMVLAPTSTTCRKLWLQPEIWKGKERAIFHRMKWWNEVRSLAICFLITCPIGSIDETATWKLMLHTLLGDFG